MEQQMVIVEVFNHSIAAEPLASKTWPAEGSPRDMCARLLGEFGKAPVLPFIVRVSWHGQEWYFCHVPLDGDWVRVPNLTDGRLVVNGLVTSLAVRVSGGALDLRDAMCTIFAEVARMQQEKLNAEDRASRFAVLHKRDGVLEPIVWAVLERSIVL